MDQLDMSSGTTPSAPAASEATDTVSNRRLSTLGRALFPPRPLQLGSSNRRLSLPSSHNITSPSTHARASSSSSSMVSPPRRRSLSPTSTTHSKHRSHSRSSSMSSGVSLLDIPLARQLHALKARNATLEAALSTMQNDTSAGLFKATARIATLEQEAEGWEAEAARLAAECETAKVEAKEQREKRKAFKDLTVRLKCELVNRKWKEKWELAIIDAEDRKVDASMVGMEFDLSMMKYQRGLDRLEIEELQELADAQMSKLSHLEAARELLLESSRRTDVSLTTARTDLAKAKKDLAAERSAHGATRGALTIAQAAVESSIDELTAERERADTAEAEVVKMRTTLEAMERGEKKEKMKEVAEAKRALEKERAAKEKAVGELRELKAVHAAALTAAAQAKAAPASKPRKATKTAPAPVDHTVVVNEDKVPESEDEAMASDDAEGEEGDDEAVKPTRVASPPAPRSRTTKPKPAPRSAVTVSSSEAEEEVYQPAPSRSRAAPTPKTISLPPSSRTAAAAPTTSRGVEAEVEPLSDEAAPPAKKTKASVLADKSTNNKRASAVVGVAVEQKEKPEAARKKREGTVVAEEGVTDVTASTAASDAAGKAKKRKLFGGPKKFSWGAIENADVNSLGLPNNLSPVKTTVQRKNNLFAGQTGLGRPSIFG